MPNLSRAIDWKPQAAAGPRSRSLVLLAGSTEAEAERLRGVAADAYEVIAAPSREAAWEILAAGQVAVLCLGEGIAGEAARDFLERAIEPSGPETSGTAPVNLVLRSGPDPALFADLIAEDRIFFLSQEPPPPHELNALVLSAARRHRLLAGTPAPGEARGTRSREAGDLLRHLSHQEAPEDVAALVAEAALDRVSGDRSYCLLYDAGRETLWARDPTSASRRDESAAVGLVSFVLRSGLPARLAHAGEDPRYEREADDPAGDGRERFLAVPIFLHDLAGPEGKEVGAVLAVVRDPSRPEFDAAEETELTRLAGQASPSLTALLPEGARAAVLDPLGSPEPGLFRRKVIEQMLRPAQAEADPLRISPTWTRISYWVLVAALAGFLVYSLLGRVDEYATGTAVVEMGGRTDLTALESGTVAAVAVAPEKRVRAGEILVRFDDARERAELERAEREFALQLVNRLRDPADRNAEQALISLRAQRELAQAQLARRALRAPADGTVADVWVRPGQYLQPGQVVLSLAGPERVTGAAGAGISGLPETPEITGPWVAVLLPGQYRPQIRRGMPMRLEISGYRYAYQKLTVGAVGDEVIGPAEAQRYLSPGVADALTVTGPVVIVRARLPSPTFVAEGKTYRYHDGMHGQAEVRVRSERILFALIPALKSAFEREH